MARSSKGWMRRHVTDAHVKKAREQGYRSRAAFKLLEIDAKDRLLKPGFKVLDLGAAPGGWLQVVTRKVGPRGRVVGVDLLPIKPIPGATIFQGDFRELDLEGALGGKADVVLSDMLPNVTGVPSVDQARAHGDLSENAEYHAARERAGFIEGRISEIESKLGNAQVIDPRLVDADGRCVFGATVEVEDGDGEKATWQIVGEDEADIKAGRISISSPIARGLIGKEAGEWAEVKTPGGVKRYEILDVRYE